MKSSLSRFLLFLTLVLFLFVSHGACGETYVAVKDGQCNDGRKWVPPQMVDGEWKAGYCTDM